MKFKTTQEEFARAAAYVSRYGLNALGEVTLEGEPLQDNGTVENTKVPCPDDCRNALPHMHWAAPTIKDCAKFNHPEANVSHTLACPLGKDIEELAEINVDKNLLTVIGEKINELVRAVNTLKNRNEKQH